MLLLANSQLSTHDRISGTHTFPASFKEALALHIDHQRTAGAAFLFESSWKKPYSDRGVRKLLARYTQAAGITVSLSPRTLRHLLFTWLKTQGIDDALIQPQGSGVL